MLCSVFRRSTLPIGVMPGFITMHNDNADAQPCFARCILIVGQTKLTRWTPAATSQKGYPARYLSSYCRERTASSLPLCPCLSSSALRFAACRCRIATACFF